MASHRVLLISGPNLNLLGVREPSLYGTETLEEIVRRAQQFAQSLNLVLSHLQADAEADIIAAIHDARSWASGMVINAGALTHYSWALADAVTSVALPTVELHLTNTAAREGWRHQSVLAAVVAGSVQGFGSRGYEVAIWALARLLES
ncbi:MAG: type II 3-dehydroquinate dehydratase [Ferrimicrobium sp.]